MLQAAGAEEKQEIPTRNRLEGYAIVPATDVRVPSVSPKELKFDDKVETMGVDTKEEDNEQAGEEAKEQGKTSQHKKTSELCVWRLLSSLAIHLFEVLEAWEAFKKLRGNDTLHFCRM